jgi:DNA modification methylase
MKNNMRRQDSMLNFDLEELPSILKQKPEEIPLETDVDQEEMAPDQIPEISDIPTIIPNVSVIDLTKTRVYEGDCLRLLKLLPDNSIDCIITDPPYGYFFMGKAWDQDVMTVEVCKEMLRVLKDGGFCFIMSAPRLDVLTEMASRLKQAGFDIKFSPIYWAYASGFTKAENLSKKIDNRKFTEWCHEKGISLKGLTNSQIKELKKMWAEEVYHMEYSETMFQHPGRGNRSYQSSAEIFSQDRGNNKVSLKVSPYGQDHLNNGHESWSSDTKIPSYISKPKLISPESQKYDGIYGGFQPKPAVEVIIVAKKPNRKKQTNIDQVLENGKGGTYLDRCRIPSNYTELLNQPPDKKVSSKEQEKLIKKMVGGRLTQPAMSAGGEIRSGFKIRIGEQDSPDSVEIDARGRFPANLIVSDDILNTDYKVGDSEFSDIFSLDRWFNLNIQNTPKEIRDAFPFIQIAKPCKSEKDKGCEEIPESQTKGGGGMNNKEAGRKFGSIKTKGHNYHPTVKPVSLMEFLIALSPTLPGDIICDPFSGSGTTLIAAKLKDRIGIGFEWMNKYVKIAEARLKAIQTQKSLLSFL